MFERFVSAALYNKQADEKKLLEAWIAEKGRQHPPQIYWAKVFPDQSFSMKQWNLLASRLFKLLEEYLIQGELQKDQSQKKFYLAKVYRKFQEEKLFKEAIRDADRALEKQTSRSTNYLQEKHDLSYEKFDYIISINRKEKTNLQEINDHLDTYFIASKLRQACLALSRKIVKEDSFQISFLEEVLQYVATNKQCLDTPAIAIYYYCYKAISSENNEHYFHQLRGSIIQYQSYFPPQEMRDIYTYAINFSIRKLNTGNAFFIQEALELYLLSLEQGYLLEDGILLESTYTNIVVLASKLKRFDWAMNFAQEYQSFLKPDFQQPLFHFSLSRLFYEQGELEKSLQELIQVESKASFLFLGARILQLKIYYELKEFDLLENLLESLRVYLQRSKDLSYRKKHYNNILIFTRQLLQVSVMDKKERAAFRQRIQDAEIFSEKDWFLSQIG